MNFVDPAIFSGPPKKKKTYFVLWTGKTRYILWNVKIPFREKKKQNTNYLSCRIKNKLRLSLFLKASEEESKSRDSTRYRFSTTTILLTLGQVTQHWIKDTHSHKVGRNL